MRETTSRGTGTLLITLLLVVAIVVCGVLTLMLIRKSERGRPPECPSELPSKSCDMSIDEQLHDRTRRLSRHLSMTGTFESGTMAEGAAVNEYNVKVYCTWEVMAKMAQALAHGKPFDETGYIAQIVGNIELSRSMLRCDEGLDDISSLPNRSKFALQVVLFTDNLQAPTYVLVKVFFDRDFLNMYTQVQTQEGGSWRMLGVSVNDRMNDYFVRALMLSPVYMRIGPMKYEAYRDANDSIQRNNLTIFAQRLFAMSRARTVEVMIRPRPSQCPYKG